MGFAAPAWLLGLLLVPVMWYLHRTGPVLRRHPVESLALWRAAEARPDSPGARRRPDPAWIRRAAICSLLAVALAGPTLPRPAARVTLWIEPRLRTPFVPTALRTSRCVRSARRGVHSAISMQGPSASGGPMGVARSRIRRTPASSTCRARIGSSPTALIQMSMRGSHRAPRGPAAARRCIGVGGHGDADERWRCR